MAIMGSHETIGITISVSRWLLEESIGKQFVVLNHFFLIVSGCRKVAGLPMQFIQVVTVLSVIGCVVI